MPDGNQLSEEATGDLVRKLADETSTLVRQELALAQAELQEKGKRAGIGAACSVPPGSSASISWAPWWRRRSSCSLRRWCPGLPRHSWP